ncbi:glycosyltransferase involved in cell wall biosynthesis [Roseateles asaccharophilus]|uniref:Glycosyltransferase involved in cell wall biosynthesis n=2 Tax=Roseateles asaccharophilus TaxID=582607 RepID=A0A4R6N2Y4_9BURK|nr:glycosyltransferase involved in cell wall biosynthesis [Roseateles asaccharophilus]
MAGVEVVSLGTPEVENSLSLKRRLLGELQMGWRAARRLFAGEGRPDIAIISSPGYLAALVIAAYSRWRRVPYVLEMRDIYPQVYAEASLIRRESALYRFFSGRSRQLYRKARLVICATQGLAREVMHDEPSAKVACVYNGFPAELLERSAHKHSRFTVCFHGVLGYFQDVDTLVAVAERLAEHNIDMLVIGYGRKESQLQASTLSNLRFLGRQPFDATIAEIERCHLGLCLRLDDGISKDAFPVKVWEYLGLGIPSVVTPPCEAGDFLTAQDCGVVHAAGDVGAIVSTVLALRDSPARWQALSNRCRLVGRSYTRAATGLAVARLISETLDVSTAPAAK